MHYHAEVWIEHPSEDVQAQLDAILAQYRERYDKNDILTGWWDWWQIGGRFTGSHDGYDPVDDPRNVETCSTCNGTGFRSDALGLNCRRENPSYTCNGCGKQQDDGTWTHGRYGAGKRLKWSTEWAEHPGDVMRVEDVKRGLKTWTLVVKDTVLHQKAWTGEEWEPTDFDGKVKSALKRLGITTGYLITVDYHS